MKEAVASLGTFRGEFLWFVTSHALTVYDYGAFDNRDIAPKIHITRFVVNGEEYDTGTNPSLAYDQNVCTFDYAGISFRETQAMRFQYRLLGANTNWQPQTFQRSVTYASLPPGSYTFEVRATNAEGVISDIPARLSFVITAPFWATWWFIGLVGIVLSGGVVLVIRGRVRRLLEIERLRSRIARDLHDEIGSNLSSIAMASELLRREPKLGDMERNKLSHISSVALTTVKDMKDIVWLIHPGNDSLDDLFLRMKDTAASILEGCPYRLDFPQGSNGRKVDLDWKRNLYLIYKEALTNIRKHSQATLVRIHVIIDDDALTLRLADNGRGFNVANPPEGNGLKNMQDRATLLGASFQVTPNPGGGIVVTLKGRIT
jgi:signal transduction histidine kinase